VLRAITRTLLWRIAAVVATALLFCALIAWPDPLFAFTLGTGKIVVASDRPIPAMGGERFLHDCERLLERSPLKAGATDTVSMSQMRIGGSACSSSRIPRPGGSPTALQAPRL
jgi:hypothetical protein